MTRDHVITTGLIYLILISILYWIGFRKDPEKGRQSLIAARQTLWYMAPLLLAIFALIGLFHEFVPPMTIRSWLGAENHLLSLLYGGLARAVAIARNPTGPSRALRRKLRRDASMMISWCSSLVLLRGPWW